MRNLNTAIISEDRNLIKKLKEIIKDMRISVLNKLDNNFPLKNYNLLFVDIETTFNSIESLKKFINANKKTPVILFTNVKLNKLLKTLRKCEFCFILNKNEKKSILKLQIHSILKSLSLSYENQKKNEILKIIDTITKTLIKQRDIKKIADIVVNSIALYSKISISDFFILDHEKRIFRLLAAKNFTTDIVEKNRTMPVKGTLTEYSLKKNKILHIKDINKEERLSNHHKKQLISEGIKLLVIIPIKINKKPFGAIHLFSRKQTEIDEFESFFFLQLKRTTEAAIKILKAKEDFIKSLIINKNLLNELNDAVLLQTIDGKILNANKKAAKILGISKNKLINKNSKNIYLEDEILKKLIKKRSLNYETKLLTEDGREKTVDVSLKILKIIDNLYIQTIIRDITKHKQTELNLKRKLFYIKLLNKITNKLQKTSTIKKIIKITSESFKNFKGNPAIHILRVNDDESRFILMDLIGFPENADYNFLTPDFKNSLNAYARQTRKVIVTEDLRKNKKAQSNIKKYLLENGFLGVISIPFFTTKRVYGIINLIYKHPISLNNDEIKMLHTIGKNIGIALENAENYEKLKLSEENYRLLANTAKDIIIVHDLKGKIQFANKSAIQKSGYSKKEIYKMNIMDAFSEEDKKEAEKRKKARISGDKSTYMYFAKFRTKNGKTIPVEVMSSPIIKNGVITSILVIARDITERLKYEERVSILAALAEQTTSAVIITDLEGRIEYVNKAFEETTGYRREEVIGKNPRILKSGKHSKLFYEELWNTIKQGKIWKNRIINKRKDGTLFTEDIIIIPIKNNEGKTIRYGAIIRDITNELKLEEHLRQAQKLEAIGNLTAGIAHDFNNILTSILGYSSMLEIELKDKKTALKKAKAIKNVGKKAKNLISQLLAYSRRQIIKLVPVDVNCVIKDMKQMLKRTISEDITLKFYFNENIKNILADRSQIEQIILNLVVNSYDALQITNKKRKTILIETDKVFLDEKYIETHPVAKKGEYVVIKVTDNGCGMSKEVMEKAFEPFFTTKEIGKGSGLGLSTVYGIVKQNNGYIFLYSEEGKGTTVKIYWPVYELKSEKIKEEKISAKRWELKCEKYALIIEDDESVRNVSEEFIKHFGFKVLSSKNGAEGLKVLKGNLKIDLVLTDVVMPEMDGVEFYKNAIKLKKDLKIIFTSGYPLTHPEIKELIDGNIKFIQKPYTVNELEDILKELFKN